MTLSLNLTDHGSHSTLFLQGELDATTADLLPPAVRTVLARGHRHLVIDAAQLWFCDSSGLHALLTAQRTLHESGATLHLARVQGVLRRILDVTGLDRAFPTAVPAARRIDGSRDRHRPGLTRWA